MQDLVLAWVPWVAALGLTDQHLNTGWTAPASQLGQLIGLTSSVLQLALLQARGKPVAGPLWLGLGLALSLAVCGTFVSAIPALTHLAAGVIGAAARYFETLRSAVRPDTLNKAWLAPTSRPAFGEPKP